MWGNNAGLTDFDELVVDLEGNDNDLLIRGCAVEMDDFGQPTGSKKAALMLRLPLPMSSTGISTSLVATASGMDWAFPPECPSWRQTSTAYRGWWDQHLTKAATSVNNFAAFGAVFTPFS